jgi:hypothetical protein
LCNAFQYLVHVFQIVELEGSFLANLENFCLVFLLESLADDLTSFQKRAKWSLGSNWIKATYFAFILKGSCPRLINFNFAKCS